MGLLKNNDECLILYGEMIKHVHLACSKAFNVQLKSAGLRNLLTVCPDKGSSPRHEKSVCLVIGPG